MSSPKYAIDLISGKLTNRDTSHKWGWAYLRKCQLEDSLGISIDVLHGESWDEYDVIFLYHGMEQDGETLNLFGGATGENSKFYERILTYRDKSLFSLDIPMPDYGRLCKNRLKNCDDHWRNVNWDELSKVCNTEIPEVQFELLPKLVLGDSHSFSTYRSGYLTHRKDGRTLAGVLRKTLSKEIDDYNSQVRRNLTHLTVYYGNIDIRHHLCRETEPTRELSQMLKEYENQLLSLNIENIELVTVLPIEDISRKLPKTGYYKGTPFYGTHAQRSLLVQMFNDELEEMVQRNQWKLFTWDNDWYTMDPVDYMTTYMEKPKSVHLAPKYHRWDYVNNKLNTIRTKPVEIIQFRNLLEF
jgi:hypothetical protein